MSPARQATRIADYLIIVLLTLRSVRMICSDIVIPPRRESTPGGTTMSSESLGNSIMTRGHECLRLIVFLEINKYIYNSYFLQNIGLLNMIILHNFNYILSFVNYNFVPKPSMKSKIRNFYTKVLQL